MNIWLIRFTFFLLVLLLKTHIRQSVKMGKPVNWHLDTKVPWAPGSSSTTQVVIQTRELSKSVRRGEPNILPS